MLEGSDKDLRSAIFDKPRLGRLETDRANMDWIEYPPLVIRSMGSLLTGI